MRDEERLSVPMPADVERPDTLMAGLTARQLAILAVAGVGLWLLYLLLSPVVPLLVFAAGAVPVAGSVVALVTVSRDGRSLDQLLAAAIVQRRRPRRMVPTSGQVPAVPDWVATPRQPTPGVLRLPPEAITPPGAVLLDGQGVVLVCTCSTVNFSLRTLGEQRSLVAGFARWLNSITAPVQVLVRADRIDLRPLITGLHDQAGGLPHPALEQAALEHAGFLTDLAQTRDLLRRHVLLVFHEPTGQGGHDAAVRRVLRRAEETARALAAAEVTVTVLDGSAAHTVLAEAADPNGPLHPATPADTGQPVAGPPEWR